MKCSICYENFIQPTSEENFEEIKREFMEDPNYDIHKFLSLLLFPNMKPRYTCNNEKCGVFYCDICYYQTINEKELFKCHFCRCYDYKTFMGVNVLRELQIKVLGNEGYKRWFMEEIHK